MEITEGWQLVPAKLTETMNVAGIVAAMQFKDATGLEALNEKRNAVYLAQLAAAPTPPAQESLEEMRQRKDQAYEERNRVVAALAKLFPSGIARTEIEGWSEDWHGCVYIDLPTGQVSWHFHDSQAHLFESLPAYTKTWDGHTTEEKYQRLAAMKVPAQEVITKFVSEQQPLGKEFENVLHENLFDLYESDKPSKEAEPVGYRYRWHPPHSMEWSEWSYHARDDINRLTAISPNNKFETELLYTRPQSDSLRKAAKEASIEIGRFLDGEECCLDIVQENLRKALEEKS